MTIIEIMIVVLIIAVAALGVSYGFGALNRTQLRAGAMRVAGAARYAYNRAIAQGTTVRLHFDFETGTMSFEEANGRITLARPGDRRRQEIEDEGDGSNDSAGVDPWEAARARLADTLHPSFGASPFSAIEGRRFQAAPLGRGIRLVRLLTPHEAEPRERGHGQIYFFPNGQTEHSVLWITDVSEQIFSIELHPLTGRVRIRATAYEPEEVMIDGDEDTSEVRG